MMPHVFKGSKDEIIAQINRLEGNVREAIVFVDDSGETKSNGTDIFAEMDSHTSGSGDFDDSRDSIYTRHENE